MMSRTYAGIALTAAFGLLLGAGCYRDKVHKPIAQMPIARPSTRPAKSPTAKPTARQAPTDARAERVADDTKRYAERLRAAKPTTAKAERPASVTPAPAPEPAKPIKVTKSAPPMLTKPGESKRAAHVASDDVEPGKAQPVAAVAVPKKPPPAAPAAAKAPKPAPKPAEPKAQPPKVVAPAPKPAPSKPEPAAPSPAKKPAAKPTQVKPAPKPVVAKATAPEKAPVKPGAKTPAAPKVAEKPAPAPTAVKPSKTAAAGKSGYAVPSPPKISTKPAKKKSARLAKAPTSPPPPPRVEIRPPVSARTSARTSATPGGAVLSATATKSDINTIRQQKLKEATANPNDLVKQMEYRLLCLAANDPKAALIEIPGTNAQTQAVIDKLMQVNVTAYQTGTRDPATAATKLLNNVEELRKLLRRHADLIVTSVKLCTRVDDYGVYEEIRPLQFPAGQRNRAIVYCEIKNFTAVPTEDHRYRVLLAQKIKVFDQKGKTVYQTSDNDVPYTSRRPREDFYLVQLIELPTALPVGKYILRVYVEDKLAAKAQENQVEFEIVRKGS